MLAMYDGTGVRRVVLRCCLQMPSMPPAHAHQHENRHQDEQHEPCDISLATSDHDQCRQQRPERGTDITADLEHRLREAEPSAGCEARDARGFRMKGRRPDADHASGQQEHRKAARAGQQGDTGQCHAHSGRQ
jgi:hypothetical protein